MKKIYFLQIIFFVVIKSNGQNVGIGTTIPKASLDVWRAYKLVCFLLTYKMQICLYFMGAKGKVWFYSIAQRLPDESEKPGEALWVGLVPDL